jgi:cholesterol oxidase
MNLLLREQKQESRCRSTLIIAIIATDRVPAIARRAARPDPATLITTDGVPAVAGRLSGVYVQNPLWNELLGRNLITGHPLGGCVMADDVRDGVVDSAGRVYSGDAGTAVHPGLWVMDAAVIPRSLGVNPGLTIAALAERSCHNLARDHGWTIPYEL